MHFSIVNVLALLTVFEIERVSSTIEVYVVDNWIKDTGRSPQQLSFFHRYSALNIACKCATCIGDVWLNVTGESNGLIFSEHITLSNVLNIWITRKPIDIWIFNETLNATRIRYSCVFNNTISTKSTYHIPYRECLPHEVAESKCHLGICISKWTGSKWQHCQTLSSTDCQLGHVQRKSTVCSTNQTYSTMCDAIVDYLFNPGKVVAPPLFEIQKVSFSCPGFPESNYSLNVKYKFNNHSMVPLGSSVILSDGMEMWYACQGNTTILICYNAVCYDHFCNIYSGVYIAPENKHCLTLTTLTVSVTVVDANGNVSTYANIICHTSVNVRAAIDVNKTCHDKVDSIRCFTEIEGQTFYDRSEFEPDVISWNLNGQDITNLSVNFWNYSVLRLRSVGSYNCVMNWKYISNPIMYAENNWAVFGFERKKQYNSFCETVDFTSSTEAVITTTDSHSTEGNDAKYELLVHVLIALSVFIVTVGIIVVCSLLYIRYDNRRKLMYVLGSSSVTQATTTFAAPKSAVSKVKVKYKKTKSPNS